MGLGEKRQIMDKKIFDIIPPSSVSDLETIEAVIKDEPEEEKEFEQKEVSKKVKRPAFSPPAKHRALKVSLPKICFLRTRHLVFLSIFLLTASLVAFSFYFYLPQAWVQVLSLIHI